MFRDSMILKPVPKWVKERTRKYYNKYSMSLYDAFKEAVRDYSRPSAELYKAWYYDDFREYIPTAYLPKYRDLEKYPLFNLCEWER